MNMRPMQHITMVHATLQVDGQVTEYRRAGAGAPVVLLAAHGEPNVDDVADTLARSSRVIVPVVEQRAGLFASWLLDFLDGVGIEHAEFVTTDALYDSLCQFAQWYPDRVCGVATINAVRSRTSELSHTRHVEARR